MLEFFFSCYVDDTRYKSLQAKIEGTHEVLC